ncbi:hypothetical protein CGRA01v4_04323 [Colletotrichum graminicola]|nr:hypothetical protein CGRA01v4_04323 [Colletotrichum graminicola]
MARQTLVLRTLFEARNRTRMGHGTRHITKRAHPKT